MREIQLTRGYVTQVDDEDYEELNRFKWHVYTKSSGDAYAVRWAMVKFGDRKRGEKLRIIHMHQQILGIKGGDHRDGNGLNNQRFNLRECNKSQNQMNRRLFKNNTSGYKGVCGSADKWKAQIMVNKKYIYLGIFSSKEDAAEAYAEAAKKHFGEFARP
jgi:hypothetical protein